MNAYRYVLAPALAIGMIGLTGSHAKVLSITATDLNSVSLGAKVVGPVGPEVETTFVNSSGDGIGDLKSSVSCPAGFSDCLPATNPAGTIYTYIHEVTPGVDFPNDPPFPSPDETLPLDNARVFHLTFPAEGFNQVVGFDFSQAAAAGVNFTIEQLDDQTLRWELSEDAGWDSGETISFFWQTTQPPSGPGGIYKLTSATEAGTGNGPLPTPIPVVSNPDDVTISEVSVSIASTLFVLGGLLTFSMARRKAS